ncbi:hypothetical protein STEG23_037412 [Scotinomys teguina]
MGGRGSGQSKVAGGERHQPAMKREEEDENLWIASRPIWFDQPRPPDMSSDISTFRFQEQTLRLISSPCLRRFQP